MKKIKICQECFNDSDLKEEDVEIISEVECVELNGWMRWEKMKENIQTQINEIKYVVCEIYKFTPKIAIDNKEVEKLVTKFENELDEIKRGN